MVSDVLYSVGWVGGNMENAGGFMLSQAVIISNFLIMLGSAFALSTLILEYRLKWRDWVYAFMTLLAIIFLVLGYMVRCVFVWNII